MSVNLNPYISFNGNARQAMEFYKTVFGGDLKMDTFKEFHMSQNPSEDNNIMHAQLTAPNGLLLMGADTPGGTEYKPGTNFAVSLSGDDEDELRGHWDKLAEGGNVTMPLDKAPWGDVFGMLVDKFGVQWMIDIYPKA